MSTTNPTWTAWGSNPGLHDEKLVTSCLSCGKVHIMQCLCSYCSVFPIHENIFSVSSYILFNEVLVIGELSGRCRRVVFSSLTICLPNVQCCCMIGYASTCSHYLKYFFYSMWFLVSVIQNFFFLNYFRFQVYV